MDQEMIVIENKVCYSSQEGGGTPPHAEPHGEAPASVRRQKEQAEGMSRKFCCSFCGKGKET